MTLPADICVSQSGPSSVTQLFERAFGEEGFHKENRPRAQEWISQLDVLRDGLRNCNQNPAHKYHKISRTCPWCDLENTSGVLYFLTYANTSQTQTTFDLKDVWSKIKAVKIPSLDKLPDVNSIQIVPTPLPEYAKPPRGLLGIVNFFLNFHNDGGERKNREFALRQAEQEWQSINRQWQALEFDSSFNSNYRGLQKAYNEYKNLPNQYQVERKATLLKIYLDRYLVVPFCKG